jgi:hypothetical protein
MFLFIRSIASLELTGPRDVADALVWRRALTRTLWLRPPALITLASLLLLSVITTSAHAQQQTTELAMSRSNSLPEAPQPQSDPHNSVEQTTFADGLATVSGIVMDGSGASIPGAQVSLTHRDGTQLRALISGGNGEFAFIRLPPGSYLVIVSYKGFAPFISGEFNLAPRQSYEVPSISLSVASANTRSDGPSH